MTCHFPYVVACHYVLYVSLFVLHVTISSSLVVSTLVISCVNTCHQLCQLVITSVNSCCHLYVSTLVITCINSCHRLCHLLSSVVSPLVISLQRTWRRHRREMLLVRDSSTLGRTSLLPNLTRKRRMGRRSVHSAVLTSTPSWVLTPSSTGRCLQCLSVHLYTHLHTYTAQRPAPTDHSCTYVCICIHRHSFTLHSTQTIKHRLHR